MRERVRLHPDTVRELAAAIADELRDDSLPVAVRPLTVAEVARKLGRSPDYVRDHRHELGVLVAEGKRPRLMFDPHRVQRAMRATDSPQASDLGVPRPGGLAKPKPQRRRLSRSTGDLLPIRGR